MARQISRNRQLAFTFPHRPALGREDFLVNACNSEAIRWIDAWPDWPSPALIVYGPTGCGKTHLAQVWRHRTQASRLTTEDIDSTPPHDLLEAQRTCIIDGIVGDARETALLHLYNTAAELGGHILIAAREPPARWNIDLPDLSSRFTAAPAAEITAPDDELLEAVFTKVFRDMGIEIDSAVIRYLLARIERSFEAVVTMARTLDRAALSQQSRITIPLARAVFEGLPDDEALSEKRGDCQA